ncbi:MAG: GHKL domain-containing protein [Lachnospiraceae bacterium]|nr:GHKL domain-containing protein [Lachnospiraceae bacterium]
MNGAFLLFSAVLTSVLRILAGLFVIRRLLKDGKPDRKSLLAGLGGAVFLGIWGERTDASLFFCLALETLLLAACACSFQAQRLRMSLFMSIFYEIAGALGQFLLAAVMGILLGSSDFFVRDLPFGQAVLWLFHGLLAVLTVIFFRIQELPEGCVFRGASAFSLAGFLAVVTLSEQRALEIPEDTLFMWTILAVSLMMSVLVFHLNRQYEMERELARLKSEQAKLLERDYTALNHSYAVHAKLFHDFHNHMGVLRQFLSHEKYEEAVGYLDELQAPVRDLTDTVWTGDETTDYLINSKAASAKDSKIQFQVQVEFPRHTNIQSADLCAILGNLLDNALEAASQVPEPEGRLVTLTIRRIHQMLIIKVENSFLKAPVWEEGRLHTTKTEGGLHGWGLKSAQAAAEKYEGMVKTGISGEMFRAVATLSYDGVEPV